MAGSKSGGLKAAKTNREKYGFSYYAEIGRRGGGQTRPETRYWRMNREAARAAGAIGGRKSRRGKSKKPVVINYEVAGELPKRRKVWDVLVRRKHA